MGRGYVIEHCISTLNLKRKKEAEEKAYRAYVTDALMMIAENTTHYMGAREMFDYGKSFTKRWSELMDFSGSKEDDQKPPEEDNRTAREFTDDMWQRIRKKRKRK